MTLGVGTIIRRSEETVFVYCPHKPYVVIIHPLDVLLQVPFDRPDPAQLHIILSPLHPVLAVEVGKDFKLLKDLRCAHSPWTGECLLGGEANIINGLVHIERLLPLNPLDLGLPRTHLRLFFGYHFGHHRVILALAQ